MTDVIVLDTETTGVDVETARVVTAFLGIIRDSGEPEAFSQWLIDPGVEIPVEASNVHGVTTEHARAEGVNAEEGIERIVERLDYMRAIRPEAPLVVYNAPYDLTLLDREARRHMGFGGMSEFWTGTIDPLVIDKATDKYRRGSRKLVDVAAHYGVTPPDGDAHEARYDAILAGRLAQVLLKKLPYTVDELQDLQVQWKREQAASFQKYLREKKGERDAVIDGSWPYKPFEEK